MFSLNPSLFIDTQKIPKYIPPFNSVISHLYVGGIDSLKQASLFDCIINCTKHIVSIPTINTIRIPIDDHISESETLLESIEETHVLEYIHQNRLKQKNVLVHCHAGMQRSCAIVAMYLIKYYKMSPDQVFEFLPKKRPIAFYPHATFSKAIYEFYNRLQK